MFSAVFVFQKVTQKIFLELDKTKASRPEFHRSFQRNEEEAEWSHEGPTHQGGAAQALAAPPMCEGALAAP
jgi:hypothetical protein